MDRNAERSLLYHRTNLLFHAQPLRAGSGHLHDHGRRERSIGLLDDVGEVRMLPILLAALLQASSLPMIEENVVPSPPPTVIVQPPAPEPDPTGQELRVTILTGGMVGLATDSTTNVEPFVRVGARFPLAANPMAPRLHAIIDLMPALGQQADLQAVSSWKSIEVSFGVSAYPVPAWNVGLWGEGGFASKLPGSNEPLFKAARWAYGGIIFDRFRAGSLKFGIGADERLDGTYQPAVTVKGWVALYQATTQSSWPTGSMVSLVGDAILGINVSSYYPGLTGGIHDVVRVGLCVGWGTPPVTP